MLLQSDSRPQIPAIRLFAGEWRKLGRQRRKTIIICNSNDWKRHWCAADTQKYGARLVRQISGNPCRQGDTWGMDPGSVWVDRGCRAQFEVVVP